MPIGSHLPLHCTATGKLFLANMNTASQMRYLKAANLEKHTDKTILDSDHLQSQLKNIADENVGYDVGEYIDGMIAVAVPVKNKQGAMCFAIAVHAPSARINIDELKDYVPALRKTAKRIAELEYS